jgi:tRNA1(Val) A37 N6-methylase TrmN6
MSTSVVDLVTEEYKQNFDVPQEIRYKYGEINTPFYLINDMFSLLDDEVFKNPNKKWLDIGTGSGYFPIILFKKLFKGLEGIFPESSERRNHIIRNMIYMTEIREDNWKILEELFGVECNLFKGDFLSTNIDIAFDFVIGNPPYNNNGLKKVPTNNTINKKEDGKTVWIPFVKKAIDLLVDSGVMVVIIPSIWLKEDKARMYNHMIQYKIENLYCMTNTETNKVFNKYAQTPTCYFRLIKEPNPGYVTIYEKENKELIEWSLRENRPIPVFGARVLQKITNYLNDENKLKVYKTNLPCKDAIISDVFDENVFKYENIKTRQLDGLVPRLVIEYSNIPLVHYKEPKLVFAHKMYGFPYLDITGKYGISNRDNYVINNRPLLELMKLREFFSTKTALYLFETTRYRMKYLEKYIFQLIPDITKLDGFPDVINDETIANYFGFDDIDIKNIKSLHKKDYNFDSEL